MNDEVLYASSKEDVIEYCRSLDNCKTALSFVCDEQQGVIRDLANAVRGFSSVVRAEHDFEMAIRRNLWIEDKMFDAYDNRASKATSDNQDAITFKKVNDPPQGRKLEEETPSVSEALRSLGNAVEGCFG